MTKILVCGGRDFMRRTYLYATLDAVTANATSVTIVHGAARGADAMAGDYATARGFRVEAYPADWKRHGRDAGPIRNQRMLDESKPDLVVAAPGGHGTRDMVRRAEKAGVPVKKIL